MWARIENGAVAELTDIDPAGRFHPSIEWVECGDEVEPGWTFVGGAFAPPPKQEESIEWLAEDARAKRDALLLKSDGAAWRAFDAGQPLSQEWIDYRAALRDVPQQAGFPANIIWPTKPQD